MTGVAQVFPSVLSLVYTIKETSDVPWLAALKTDNMRLGFMFVFSLHD